MEGAPPRLAFALASLGALAACSSGGAPAGDACHTATDCKSGLVCVPISGGGVCQAPGSSCASGAACEAFQVCVNGQCVPTPDAGTPPVPDAGFAPADAGPDAGPDAGLDAGLDAGASDGGPTDGGDAGGDAGPSDGGDAGA